jgi:hypothetical protein
MIIQLELENLINRYREHESEKAKDVAYVLTMALKEIRELHELTWQQLDTIANHEIAYLKQMQEVIELKVQIEQMTNVINKINEGE